MSYRSRPIAAFGIRHTERGMRATGMLACSGSDTVEGDPASAVLSATRLRGGRKRRPGRVERTLPAVTVMSGSRAEALIDWHRTVFQTSWLGLMPPATRGRCPGMVLRLPHVGRALAASSAAGLLPRSTSRQFSTAPTPATGDYAIEGVPPGSPGWLLLATRAKPARRSHAPTGRALTRC